MKTAFIVNIPGIYFTFKPFLCGALIDTVMTNAFQQTFATIIILSLCVCGARSQPIKWPWLMNVIRGQRGIV